MAGRAGNRHPDHVPHGVFPCRPEPERAADHPGGGIGAEGWVAISCADDDQWRSLVALTGLPDDDRWATAAGRRIDEDRIEELLAAWTSPRRGRDIAAQLQPHVACAPVLGVPELHTDPQIVHRGYWVPTEHPIQGQVPYSGMQATMSRTPGIVPGPGPCLGEHSWYVLESILGLDGDTISSLLVDDIVEITG